MEAGSKVLAKPDLLSDTLLFALQDEIMLVIKYLFVNYRPIGVYGLHFDIIE